MINQGKVFWLWVMRPFRVRVYVFEHTRISVRSFPPLFQHEYVDSLQERINQGGDINLEAAQYVIYEQMRIPFGSALRGKGITTTLVVPPEHAK